MVLLHCYLLHFYFRHNVDGALTFAIGEESKNKLLFVWVHFLEVFFFLFANLYIKMNIKI